MLDNTEDPGKLGGFCNGSVPCIDDHAKCDDTSSNGVCKCDAINFFRNHEGICIPGRLTIDFNTFVLKHVHVSSKRKQKRFNIILIVFVAKKKY